MMATEPLHPTPPSLSVAMARASRHEDDAQRQRHDAARRILFDALFRAKLAMGDTGLDEADLRDIDALTAIAVRLSHPERSLP